MKKLKLFPIILLSGLMLSACGNNSLPASTSYSQDELEHLGDDITTPWVDYSAPITSVTFDLNEYSIVLQKGETHTYHPRIQPSEAKASNLIWSSTNENVATIDNGVLNAVGGGEAKIVVSSKDAGSFQDIELKVEVQVKLRNFTIDPVAVDLDLHESAKLRPVYDPLDTTEKELTFTLGSEDDANVISLSEDGTVEAKGVEGTASVKVTSPYINSIVTVPVVVSDKATHVEEVIIANKLANLELGKTENIRASVSPDNASENGIIYESSDPGIASIDELGNVTAKEPGQVTIKATAKDNGKFDSFHLVVYEVKGATIEFEQPYVELNLGEYKQLRTIYRSTQGDVVTPSRPRPTYESSDSSIVDISSAGLATARNVGNAVITVTDGDLVAQATIVVDIQKTIFTLTDLPAWLRDDGAVVYAWVWGGSSQGSWTPVVVDGIDGTFRADATITNFLLARCIAGTDADHLPNWDARGNEQGRIYNKTSDFSVTAGLVSYSAPDSFWVPYPELPTTGFGFLFTNGSFIAGEPAGEFDGKEQFLMSAVTFAEGDKFQVYDFGNKAGWVEAIDGWSFDGDSAQSEAWKEYLEMGESQYTVKQTFTADVYLKIGIDGNSIYFGLVKPETGIKLDKDNVIVKMGESAVVKASNYVGELKAESSNELVATASVDATGSILITPIGVGEAKINLHDDGSNTASISVQVKEASDTSRDIYLNSKGKLEAADPALFVHAWNDDGFYQTVKFALVEGQTIVYKATLDEKAESILIARCETGASDIVWGDESTPSNVWNQTDNMTLGEHDMFVFESYIQDTNKFTVTNNENFDPTKTYKADETPASGYYLVGTFNGWVASDEYQLIQDAESTNKYSIKGVELASGDKIKVQDPSKGNDGYYGNAGTWENCGFTVEDNGNVVLNEAGTYDIDFYLQGDNNNHIVPTKKGEPQPPVTEDGYYLVGNFTEPTWTALEAYKLTADAENVNHYKISNVTLAKEAELKVKDDKNNVWYTNATEGDLYTLGGTDSTDNIVLRNAGTYDIDFYVTSEYNNHIVLTLHEEPPVVTDAYYLVGTFNEWAISDTYKLAVDAQNANHYSIKDIVLEEGDKIKVNNPSQGKDGWYSNATVGELYNLDEEGNVVLKADGTYDVDFYVTSEYNNHIVLTKHEGPTPPPPGDKVSVSFTINYGTNWGESIYMVGTFNGEDCWSVEKGKALEWTEGNNWTITIEEDKGVVYSFKFVVVSNGQIVRWEGGSDRSYTFESNEAKVFDWQN